MKVAIFMPSLNDGGVQKIVYNLYNGFKEKNIETHLIAADARGKYNELLKGDANIIDLKKRKLRGDYKCLFSIIKLKKILQKNDFDVVIAVPGFATVSLLLAVNRIKNKPRSIVMVDNTISLLKKGKLKHKISYYIYKRLYKKADKIVVAHDVGKNDIMKSFQLLDSKVIRIYHPMIKENDINSNSYVNHKWIDNGYYVVFAAGRLCKEKNFESLIRSFAKFKNDVSNAKLIIAGIGQEESNIKKEIIKSKLEKDVDMIGFSNKVMGYMKKCQLYVLSSQQEAFGIVLVEALASGMEIVSTDCSSGAQREILKNGEFGYLCEVNNDDDLYRKMILAYNNGNIHKNVNQARAKDFTVDKSIDEYISLMKGLI